MQFLEILDVVAQISEWDITLLKERIAECVRTWCLSSASKRMTLVHYYIRKVHLWLLFYTPRCLFSGCMETWEIPSEVFVEQREGDFISAVVERGHDFHRCEPLPLPPFLFIYPEPMLTTCINISDSLGLGRVFYLQVLVKLSTGLENHWVGGGRGEWTGGEEGGKQWLICKINGKKINKQGVHHNDPEQLRPMC